VRIGRYRFAPRLLPTVAAVLFIALTGWLSRWQGHRAEEKEARQALYEARMAEPPVDLAGGGVRAEDILFRRVHATGTWIASKQAFVDNQVIESRGAGFDVLTPLRLAGSDAVVLVNRGWIKRTAAYPRPPEVPVPPGNVEVSGLAALPPARFVELTDQPITGNVFQNLTIERFRRWSGLAVLPFEVVADPPGEGLAPVVERPDAGAEQNRQYQATWFLLAATAGALWLGLNLSRAR
jgi:surfeit locus 1 family protein